jgi:hypothetical protein
MTMLKDLPDDHTMTLQEAAAAIHPSVKPRTLADAVADAKLASHKVGKTVLVTAGDVRAYWNACKRPAKKCPDRAKDRTSKSMDQTTDSGLNLGRDFPDTSGTSSGPMVVGARRDPLASSTSTAAQRSARKLIEHSKVSSPSGASNASPSGQTVRVVPMNSRSAQH